MECYALHSQHSALRARERRISAKMPSRLLPNDHVPSHTPLPPPATLVRQKSSLREPYRIKRASSHVWVVVMACHTGPNDTVLLTALASMNIAHQ